MTELSDRPALTLKQAIEIYGAESTMLRHLNRNEVLRFLRGRAEEAHRISSIVTGTELSRPTVDLALSDLAARGLVVESVKSSATPRGGRPARLYQFDASAGYVAALTVTPSEITVSVADLGERVLSQTRVAQADLSRDPNPLRTIQQAARSAIDDLGLSMDQLEVVVLGVRGLVSADGIVQASGELPFLIGEDAHAELLRLFPCPVLIENDANLATLAEHKRLAGPHDVVGLLIGDGVGCGLILHGELYRGAHGGAGEFFSDEPDGPWGSTNRAIRDYVAEHGLTFADFYAEAAAAPGRPRSLVEQYAADIARLTQALLVLDPPVIIIGGEIVNAGDTFLRPLRDRLVPNLYADTKIIYSDLGADCLRSGALQLAFDSVSSQLFAV